MQSNEPISIEQVENGFVVSPSMSHTDSPRSVISGDKLVFRSITELALHLEGHFDHRGCHIPSDPEV